MTRKEYKEILKYELYKYANGRLTPLNRLRIKYFQPNLNCVFLARKMWYLYSQGGILRLLSKFIYLKIIHKYGCVIFPSAQIGKGFHITHPVGIVIGQCKAGEDFMVFQNCSIGSKRTGNGEPVIGNNVRLGSNSVLIGHISVADNVVIGAHSLVVKDISEPGVYAGNPLKKIE